MELCPLIFLKLLIGRGGRKMKKIMLMIAVSISLLFFTALHQQVWAEQIQKGDIIVFGQPQLKQGEKGNLNQKYLVFFEEASRSSGLYTPFWGENFFTWDGEKEPMGIPYWWGHIEIATTNTTTDDLSGIVTWPEGQDFGFVVLRPNENIFDVNRIVEVYGQLLNSYTGYNQPFVGMLIHWVKQSAKSDSIDWFQKGEIFSLWKELYGVDFEKIPTPVKYQQYQSTDIADQLFMKRTVDCSSLTAWAIIYGWLSKEPSVRDLFLNRPEVIAAVDAVAPGQLARFLVEWNLAKIVIIKEIIQ